jgi:hypothetical protein
LVVLFVAGVVGTAAQAQVVKKGTLSGTIVSQGATIPFSDSVPVYTAPAAGDGFFILTQVCASAQSVTISGSVLGPLAVSTGNCQSFTPGVALFPSEVLTCSNSSGNDQECMVTGLLSKK